MFVMMLREFRLSEGELEELEDIVSGFSLKKWFFCWGVGGL